MTAKNKNSSGRTSIESLRMRCSEDPDSDPISKETAFQVDGDGTHFSVTSCKKVVYSKLLQRPEFQVSWINVIGDDGQRAEVNSIEEVLDDPSLSIIGVVGRIPVGAMSIGIPRNSNSHAEIVK